MNPRNFMVSALAVLVFITLAVSNRTARAETIGATNTPYTYWQTTDQFDGFLHVDSTKIGAANKYCTRFGRGLPITYQGHIDNGGTQNYFCANGSPNTVGGPMTGTEYRCPSTGGWTLIAGNNCTRPDCVAPQTRNQTTGACEAPQCTSKAVADSGFFDVGTDPGSRPSHEKCYSGCKANFNGGSVTQRVMISGVYHYWAPGEYVYEGGGSASQCVATAATSPSGNTVPNPTCRPDQIEGQINGVLTCLNVPGTAGAPATVNNPNAPVTTSTTNTTTNTTNNTTTETTTINMPGGGTQTTVKTCDASGNCQSSTSEQLAIEADFMKPVPVPVAGTLNAVTSLATDDTRTFASVWSARRAQMAATPLFSLASSLTSFPSVESATCPSFAMPNMRVLGVSVGGDLSPPCWIWPVLRAFLLLTSLFVARRLVFGG